MISKKQRLTEREVKKVLQKGKPFFSYGLVVNTSKNKQSFPRFAIVIGSKTVPNAVHRNFFRRKFYDLVHPYISQEKNVDCVFVVKKKTKLDKNNLESIMSFEKDVLFLLKKSL